MSLETNQVSYKGRAICLGERRAEILYVLREAMPNYVPSGTMLEKIWGVREKETTIIALRTSINNLRRLIAPLGLAIETRWKLGYRLVYRS